MHRRKNMTASFVLGAGESEWPHRCRQQSERRGNLREVCSVLILYVGEHRAFWLNGNVHQAEHAGTTVYISHAGALLMME